MVVYQANKGIEQMTNLTTTTKTAKNEIDLTTLTAAQQLEVDRLIAMAQADQGEGQDGLWKMTMDAIAAMVNPYCHVTSQEAPEILF